VLNNAIGGDLGGAVDDASFPQVVEIDYVRVYSAPFNRSLQGKTKVYENAQNVIYSLPGDVANEDAYVWSAPVGATIVSGQGTKDVVVDWGAYVSSAPLNLNLEVTTSCDVFNLTYPVTVYQDLCNVVLEDADLTHNLDFKSATGMYRPEYVNKNPNAINSSTKVMRYYRSITEPNDRLVYSDVLLADIVEYEAGNKVFFIDVMTSAPVGTEIKLQFQSSSNSTATNYPAGVRSTCTTFTTKSGEWERLRFSFSSLDNASIAASKIDELVLVFDPGNLTDAIYDLDNFKQGKVQDGCVLDQVNTAQNTESLVTYPNPVSDYVTIQFPQEMPKASLLVFDLMGNVVMSQEYVQNGGSYLDINLRGLPAGTYYIRLLSEDKTLIGQLIKI
jgi:hypothetical protein